MDYKEALSLIEENKQVNNYLIINFQYSFNIILPYKQGLALMDALNHAEQIEDRYSANTKIYPLKKDSIRATLLSQADYRKRKMATLLNVTLEDLDAIENPAPILATTE